MLATGAAAVFTAEDFHVLKQQHAATETALRMAVEPFAQRMASAVMDWLKRTLQNPTAYLGVHTLACYVPLLHSDNFRVQDRLAIILRGYGWQVVETMRVVVTGECPWQRDMTVPLEDQTVLTEMVGLGGTPGARIFIMVEIELPK